jgi:hypothetical protein
MMGLESKGLLRFYVLWFLKRFFFKRRRGGAVHTAREKRFAYEISKKKTVFFQKKKKKKMFKAGGLLPFRETAAGTEYLLLHENRYNKEVLHVAGGKVEEYDQNIRATIKREFIEEVGDWPRDLERRVRAAPLSCPTYGYCLATVDVSDVTEEPPDKTHWVSASSPTHLPLSWLASRCVTQTDTLSRPMTFGPVRKMHRVQNA